ncbi:hypothetical protein POX_b03438 [Penicillium oxalicum]|uniref:hypothetical protein n=1 Tax=Penicillium oxalicum TaxID=69781 RepID=UPI0020B79E19|nr:hypothetical protein POX_b03438 [Penicillium oxalicum]KAI2793383.1 hypothetical protein POX_b03438 [Penicillium oxalicum]
MASMYELEPWCVPDFPGHENETLQGPVMGDQELYSGFMTGTHDWSLTMQEDPQTWVDDHPTWDAQPEYPKAMETYTQRYPQSWVDAGLTIHSPGGKWSSFEEPSGVSNATWSQRQMYTDPSSHAVERQRWNSLMATQRALFMTPTAPVKNFTGVPGSPLSDPCGTPDTSNASLGSWEPEQDGEDLHSIRSPQSFSRRDGPSDLPYLSAQPAHQWKDEDCSATLEMPDGTTRRTLNWLPVDTSAGFTIGADQPDHPQQEQEMHNFQDMHGAFIPPSSQFWAYDR